MGRGEGHLREVLVRRGVLPRLPNPDPVSAYRKRPFLAALIHYISRTEVQIFLKIEITDAD